jgi:hypothetical protein
MVNSVSLFLGAEFSFIIGLGITQVIDAIGMGLAEEIGRTGNIIAVVFSTIVAGVFVLFGLFGRKGIGWMMIVGMVLYGLDGLLFLLVKDWLSMGFHVFALVFIFKGYQALNLLKADRQQEEIQMQEFAEEDDRLQEPV